ncbi:MAG: response regulator [Acetobacteraceae bacterium]|nr:MAG: response regulator [Acetobacteraceae bacterium]
MAPHDQMPDEACRGPSQRPQVLVIEDEVVIAMMLEQILVEAGYDVIMAFSGEEALVTAASLDRMALVVTDIGLTYGIDGRSVLRELRAKTPHLPAVVVTGFGEWRHEADLRGLGGPTARLLKPFGTEELMTSIQTVLAARAKSMEEPARLNRVDDRRGPSR